MACPGGCVCGAGQPVTRDADGRRQRAKGLYSADKMMQLHKSQDNHMVTECYAKYLEKPGSHTAHKLLHTDYQNRRRIFGESLVVLDGEAEQNQPKLAVAVCVGTSCFLRGSQTLLKSLVRHVEEQGLDDAVGIEATFCFEKLRLRADDPRRRRNLASLHAGHGPRGHRAATGPASGLVAGERERSLRGASA